MDSPPRVSAVILNSSRCADTLDCLESLERLEYPACSAIVLDNASHDDSVPAIKSRFPKVRIIPLMQNRGYAGNNNIGIEAALAAGADWVLVLNEDTVLAPDCLTRLVAAGKADGHIGFVGPMVYHYDEPQVIQSAGGRLDRLWVSSHFGQNETDHGQYNQVREVDWVTGCSLLARSRMIRHIGLLDERFFYYWEETEWCLRARRNGWRIVHVPQAKVWHKGVQRLYRPGPSVAYYNTRNRFLLLAKYHAPLAAWGCAWIQTLRTLLSLRLRPKNRALSQQRNAVWRGIVDFLHQRWGQMGG